MSNRELGARLALAFDRYVNIMINEPTITSADHKAFRDQLAREIETVLNLAKVYGK